MSENDGEEIRAERVVARFYQPLSLRGLDTMLEALQECVGAKCYMRGTVAAAWEVVTRDEPLPREPSVGEQMQAMLDEAAQRRAGAGLPHDIKSIPLRDA